MRSSPDPSTLAHFFLTLKTQNLCVMNGLMFAFPISIDRHVREVNHEHPISSFRCKSVTGISLLFFFFH